MDDDEEREDIFGRSKETERSPTKGREKENKMEKVLAMLKNLQ